MAFYNHNQDILRHENLQIKTYPYRDNRIDRLLFPLILVEFLQDIFQQLPVYQKLLECVCDRLFTLHIITSQ